MVDTVSQDSFFAGALTLRQPVKGHRIGTDAVLLAACCPPLRRICDLGAGVGAVGLRAAQMHEGADVTLVERHAPTAQLARENVALNGLEPRVSLVVADVFDPAFAAQGTELAGSFDCVLTNPPFDVAGSVRSSPDAARAAAHVMDGTLDGWVRAGVRLLRPQGVLVMIHRADRIADIFASLDRRFGAIRLCFVHPSAEKLAHRVLVRATKGARGPLTVLPPLVLHEATGAFTPSAAALHDGAAVQSM